MADSVAGRVKVVFGLDACVDNIVKLFISVNASTVKVLYHTTSDVERCSIVT